VPSNYDNTTYEKDTPVLNKTLSPSEYVYIHDADSTHVSRSGGKETEIYDAPATLSAGEEIILKEITGAGRFSALNLSEESLASLGKVSLEGIILCIYVDGGVRPTARVNLSDLVKLGGSRPLNISYAANVRFVLINEGNAVVTVEKLSVYGL
jgi:hypothetical protein